MHAIESSTKAQNRFADCFIRQVIPDVFGYTAFCSFDFSLLNLLIYYCSVLHVNKVFCHNDVPTKLVVAALVTIVKPTCCSVAKFVF